MSRLLRATLLLCVAACQTPAPLLACGPWFPSNLLDRGDDAVLVAPAADFVGELQRMKLVQSRFQAVLPEAGRDPAIFAHQAAAAELSDLEAALKKAKIPEAERERIGSDTKAARARLNEFIEDTGTWERSHQRVAAEEGSPAGKHETPPPQFPNIEIPAGLPGEFADYLEGALGWHNPAVLGKGMARGAWQRLLDRPATERRFKSTWAAYMLGASYEKEEPDKAVEYYKQVRDLARHGFVDSVGLAAASTGREARIYLHQEKYEQAIELYLEQLATEDVGAGQSLAMTARAVLTKGSEVLRPLALNPRAQRVLTAYVISHTGHGWMEAVRENATEPDAALPKPNAARAWLEAVEAAGVRDVDSAAKLALAAYQRNEMALAERWIKRAPSSALAEWLQAKLLLREGKTAQAAALLAGVVRAFPIEPPNTNRVAKAQFQELLWVGERGGEPEPIPAARQVLGELGALRLARREYAEALDALLNAGFWMDAAYVAERVLALDELKIYVDGYWPPVPPAQAEEEKEKYGQSETSPALLRTQIRYLLARRLMRSSRGDVAGAYYPPEWTPQYVALAQALRIGWDESGPAGQRAQALFQAAVITRTNGMELIGTELEPDWHIHAGNYEEGVSVASRATNEHAKVMIASADELSRATRHSADPEKRFHYRYQAAALAWEAAKLLPNNFEEAARMLCTAGGWLRIRDPEAADTYYYQVASLGWEAAKLMPDNSEDTARVLCIAGRSIKNCDPQKADIFYKALVRRNGQTAIGMEADRIRWFPQLDEQGKVKPCAPSRLESLGRPLPGASPEHSSVTEAERVAGGYPIPGKRYVVHAGDTLAQIAQAASVFGRVITVGQILKENRFLDGNQLAVGQMILIPGNEANGSTTPATDDSTPAPDDENMPDAPATPAPPETSP